MRITLTVFFDDPFWVGVFERADEDGLRVARVVFGDEPSGPELLSWVVSRYYAELRFSRTALEAETPEAARNPKRNGACCPRA